MLVPIPSITLDCIRETGLWLCTELRDLLSTFARTGNISATWRALQCELACERLLWGRPLCFKCYKLSVNLGPGELIASRSLTEQLGFLALDSATACMQFENSIPNVSIWTASVCIGKAIARAAGIHDNIDASYPVVGRLLVLALLKDLYEFGKVASVVVFGDFLVSLKNAGGGLRTTGAITADGLVELLATTRRSPVHSVFSKLCKMIANHGLPLKNILLEGITEVGLHFFPAFNTVDAHRNAILSWDFRMNYWRVTALSESSSTETGVRGEVFTQLAKGELERRGIIYPSRLKKLPPVWPWILPCLRKLCQEKLTNEQTATTLTFLSAVAFAMQGWYVDYEGLASLLKEVPVRQFRLKVLEISSKFELAKFNFQKLKIFRLHHSIPHKLDTPKTKDDKRLKDLEQLAIPENEPMEDTTVGNRISADDNVQSEPQMVQTRTMSCLTVGSAPRRWTAAEIEILDALCQASAGNTDMQMYALYRQKCLVADIPFRTFYSFYHKLHRVRSGKHDK